MILQYWSIIEAIVIIGIFAFVILKVVHSARQRKTNQTIPPKTLSGRIRFALFYLLRVVGLGLGTFLAVALGVMIERNIYSTITETMPTPSEVDIPPDLPFDVEEVKFEGGDGLTMAGWKVPSQNGATIILLHGYGGNRTAMLWHAKQLVDAGMVC